MKKLLVLMLLSVVMLSGCGESAEEIRKQRALDQLEDAMRNHDEVFSKYNL
jgi:uncharacterized lipoprotein